MYTPEQQKFLEYVTEKVKNLFLEFPAPGHDFDHATAVGGYAKEVAATENVRSVFLCELAGILHDIGRSPEHHTPGNILNHYELSYNMLRQWFREDSTFNFLTDAEKIELLYAIRYHWSDFADDYDTAWILRDADKLDGFGCRGYERMQQFYNGDETKIYLNCRLSYQCWYWVRTNTARHIAQEKNLMEEMNTILRERAISKILPIEL